MHAVLITFTTDAPVDELVEPFTAYARGLCSVNGLISKTWIGDGMTLGGFHLFTSRDAANAYLGSDMAAGLVSNPLFHDFTFQHFDVFEDLSAITGSPHVPLAA